MAVGAFAQRDAALVTRAILGAVNWTARWYRPHGERSPAEIAQAFRRHYYQIARQTLLEQRQVLPCYAGVASAHIAPNGDVWTCCIRAEPMGNLRDAGYDLRKVWGSQRADELRDSIRRGECHCPLANAAYSSMLCDPPSLALPPDIPQSN